jgi:membrane fusion protein, heavy metal efflux system
MKISCVLILSVLLVSCSSKQTDDHSHEHGRHEHGPEPLSYTVYADSVELFVEFKPLVVGQVSSFATHVTLLRDNFIPLTDGSVRVSFITGDKGIRNTADTASSPGIYRLALKPVVAGTGRLIFDIKTPLFTEKIVLNNISAYADAEAAQQADHAHDNTNEISYLKEQAWHVEFATILVKKNNFHNVIKTGGMVLPAPGDEIIVTSPAAGNISIKGNIFAGTEMRKGEVFFTLTAGNTVQNNLDVAYSEAKANYETAKAGYERASELVKDKIISQRQFQQAQLEYENARKVFNTFSRNYTGSGLQIKSPMDGYIRNLLVTDGQFVQTGTELVAVSKNQKLILQANLSQRYFDQLNAIRSATFKTTNSSLVYNTDSLDGKIISFGRSAGRETPFIPVTFEIMNSQNLIPGSVAEVYLKTSAINDALVVPVSALIEEQGIYFVYVQTGGESFIKREVQTGASDGELIQITSGINEGERVVSKGAYQIKLSQASGTMPAHGHEH